MKFQKGLSTCTAIAISLSSSVFAGGRSDGGSDTVEVLFLQAQKDAIDVVNRLDLTTLDAVEALPASIKNWLKSGDHLSKLQFYIQKMEMGPEQFVDGPCVEILS